MPSIIKSTRPMTPDRLKREARRTAGIILGAFGSGFFLNFFIVPAGFYTGGILGACQILRTVLIDMGFHFGGIDVAGVFYYMINIPLIITAFFMVGKVYFFKTLVAISAESFFFAVIPIPDNPILINDPLAACIIGGIGAGASSGFLLRMGGNDGGMNLGGVLLMKKKVNISVGMANIIVNIFVYITMFFMFNAQVVIYSGIYATMSAFTTDRFFSQSINVEAHIIVKKDTGELRNEIFDKLGRGITKWTAIGAYTGNDKDIFYVIINKYELNHLIWIVRKYDPNALVISNQGVQINGNFEKRID